MTNVQAGSIGALLLGKTREAVIGLLFTFPGAALHVREIARRTGFAAPTVARELLLLQEAGVLTSSIAGRQVHYRPDPTCVLFPELQSIAAKTWGLRGRIEAMVQGIPGIQCAFVFGSFATGSTHTGSDVDLLVIGSADFAVLSEAMSRVSAEVGRPVNAKLYRPMEWTIKLAQGNAFVVSVANGPKLFVKGDEGVLNAVAESRATRAGQAPEPASTYAARDRKSPAGGARLRGGRKAPRHS